MVLPNYNFKLPRPLETLSLKMKTGYSPLNVVVGDETGIGKSRWTLRASELIMWRTFQQKWEMKDNVFFSMNKFKESLFNATGRIMIIEEGEIELGSDEWQSISNRWFSRIKDTQRIKGNVYFIVLPIFMALARKHRRRVNLIIDVKGRGFANVYKIIRKPVQLLGDELSKIYIGSVQLNLPDCDKEFEILDRLNKQRIEKEQGDLFDKEIKYKELREKKRMIKLEKEIKKEEQKTELFVYRCHACKFIFDSEKEIDKVMECPNCHKRVYIDIQNLIKSNNSYPHNELNNEDEDEDEDMDYSNETD